mgnify:CR=1 FL=1
MFHLTAFSQSYFPLSVEHFFKSISLLRGKVQKDSSLNTHDLSSFYSLSLSLALETKTRESQQVVAVPPLPAVDNARSRVLLSLVEFELFLSVSLSLSLFPYRRSVRPYVL